MRFVHWFACVYFLLCIPLFAFNRPDARLAVTDHSSTWHRLFAELTSIIPRPIARLCLLSALYTAVGIQPSRRSPGCYRPLTDFIPIICRTHIDHSRPIQLAPHSPRLSIRTGSQERQGQASSAVFRRSHAKFVEIELRRAPARWCRDQEKFSSQARVSRKSNRLPRNAETRGS